MRDGSRERCARRTRLVFRDGRATKKQGPYGGEHELPAAALELEVRTREEAIGWAERYGKILVNGEIELGQVKQPWELGLMPVPKNPPLHFLLIEKAGVLVKSLRLTPSAEGKRLVFRSNDMMVIDGPFAESKELLGGFAVMEVSGMDEALALSRRYAGCLGGTVELDLRPLEQEDE